MMKIYCVVRWGEKPAKTYKVDCGDGSNPLAWLATSACNLYGADAHPKGLLLPTMLLLADGDLDYPHPRTKLGDVLKNRQTVFITIMDRSRA